MNEVITKLSEIFENLINEYKEEASMNIEERSTNFDEAYDDLNKNIEKFRSDFNSELLKLQGADKK